MPLNIEVGHEIVSKFYVRDSPLYIKVLWKDDEINLFLITVIFEGGSWTGHYTAELATKRIERLDESLEEYKKNVKNSLSANVKGYIYDFIQSPDDQDSATFIWKKQYENAIQIQGVVPLRRDEVPLSINTLIDILLEQNQSLLSQVNTVKKTNDKLKQEQEQYLQRLEELTESKILLEATLYGRFVQVLNEKKKRIQLLEDHIKGSKG